MGYDINGARLAPGSTLSSSHRGCAYPPGVLCDGEYRYEYGNPTIIQWQCGKGEVVSYVNSSKYEYETPLQEAQRKLEELKEQTAATHRQIERLKRQARFGLEPSGGSIIKFEKSYGAIRSKYTYAALRVKDLWYLTGADGYHKPPMTWEQLKTFIGDGKMWTPKNYEQAPDA